tara:strand:- start:1239 stop:1565 length:327 start_codon:yes stop_codon:yes gene_type:complete
LEPEHTRFAQIAGGRLSRGTVGARLKKPVTTTKLTTVGYTKDIVGISDITDYFQSFIINDGRSNRDSNIQVRSIASGSVRTPTGTAVFRSNKRLETKVHQGIEGRVSN